MRKLPLILSMVLSGNIASAQSINDKKEILIPSDLNIYTVEEELVLGESSLRHLQYSFYVNQMRDTRFVNDKVILEYLNSLSSRLESHISNMPFSCSIYALSNIEDLGATNLSGCKIVISLELIAKSISEDTLAGVMSHELAHTALRHVTSINTVKIILRKDILLINDALNKAKKDKSSERMQKVLSLLLKVRNREYSEKIATTRHRHELEADAASIRIMIHAGFNPSDVIELMKEREQLEESPEYKESDASLLYPSATERIRAMTIEIKKMLPRGYRHKDSSKKFLLVRKRAQQILESINNDKSQ